ncbi:hypothetical protein CKAH01_05561 [Colletotrichum kahawae]|uniref:Uncharacterized protein n=1 Tax=Colletotrichum kahawae TaxID=34407 RepID=A0AAE0D672_COLKA|nr:hypothetical protein CKAH01_05561 [Colletotrichum kahawae]
MAPAWLEKYIVRVDATPDPRRNSEQPVHELNYTALVGHRRIVGVNGDTVPRYEVKRRAILGAWGDKCDVTSPVDGNREVAMTDFHSLPPSTEIQFAQDNRKVIIKATEGQFEPRSGLPRLHWKATGMVVYGKASWELRDDSNLVMSVAIDDHQVNGVISLWRSQLEPATIEELVVVGISKIEDYRRMLRTSKTASVQAAASATWLAAS